MSSITRQFISDEISRALARAGLGYDHPIRVVLEKDAEVVGLRDAAVRVRGQLPDDRIEELRRDPRFAGSFPVDPPKVARGDTAKLRANFEQIANGTTVVE
jgi:hypothetical protein